MAAVPVSEHHPAGPSGVHVPYSVRPLMDPIRPLMDPSIRMMGGKPSVGSLPSDVDPSITHMLAGHDRSAQQMPHQPPPNKRSVIITRLSSFLLISNMEKLH